MIGYLLYRIAGLRNKALGENVSKMRAREKTRVTDFARAHRSESLAPGLIERLLRRL